VLSVALWLILPSFSQPNHAQRASSGNRRKITWPQALAGLRTQILTLPSDTILCPGHGPLTTVAEEKIHNPFA